MRRGLTHLRRQDGGAALVEFALLAPALILLFFGTIQVVQAVQAHRKLAHVGAAIGEVVARERRLDAAELQDILSAGQAMMAPFPGATLGERVMSFSADDTGSVRRDWQVSGPPYTGNAPAALPAGFLQPGETVIVADVSYAYSPMFDLAVSRPLTFQKRTFHRPRLGRPIELD